jgi:hypothetical protein
MYKTLKSSQQQEQLNSKVFKIEGVLPKYLAAPLCPARAQGAVVTKQAAKEEEGGATFFISTARSIYRGVVVRDDTLPAVL